MWYECGCGTELLYVNKYVIGLLCVEIGRQMVGVLSGSVPGYPVPCGGLPPSDCMQLHRRLHLPHPPTTRDWILDRPIKETPRFVAVP